MARSIAVLCLMIIMTGCAAQRLELASSGDEMVNAVAAATPTPETPVNETGYAVFLGSPAAVALEIPGAFQGPDRRFGASFPCTTTVASVLEAYGFLADQIERVRYFTRTSQTTTGSRRLQGFNAWISFNDRQGQLVVSLLPSCVFQTAYVRAGLELPGQVV